MGADYDQKDARGFINLDRLPIQVRALLAQGQLPSRRNEALGRAFRKRPVG